MRIEEKSPFIPLFDKESFLLSSFRPRIKYGVDSSRNPVVLEFDVVVPGRKDNF
jgi:hypothetical protein